MLVFLDARKRHPVSAALSLKILDSTLDYPVDRRESGLTAMLLIDQPSRVILSTWCNHKIAVLSNLRTPIWTVAFYWNLTGHLLQEWHRRAYFGSKSDFPLTGWQVCIWNGRREWLINNCTYSAFCEPCGWGILFGVFRYVGSFVFKLETTWIPGSSPRMTILSGCFCLSFPHILTQWRYINSNLCMNCVTPSPLPSPLKGEGSKYAPHFSPRLYPPECGEGRGWGGCLNIDFIHKVYSFLVMHS